MQGIAMKWWRRRLSTPESRAIPALAPTPIELWRWIDPDDLSAALPLLPSPFAEVFGLCVILEATDAAVREQQPPTPEASR